MIAKCNNVDLSGYVGKGYIYAREPQYGTTMTALNGIDYTAKLRDRVILTVPFIPLTLAQLSDILQLFPDNGAYVTWTYYDPVAELNRVVEMKYDTRSTELRCVYKDGTEYYSGLVIKLIER